MTDEHQHGGQRGTEMAETASERRERPPTDISQPQQWGGVDVIHEVARRFKTDPVLAVPFVCAGLVIAILDFWRRRDVLPVSRPESLARTLDVQAAVVPSGVPRTVRHADALVDLRPQYLAAAVGIELLASLVLATAGWLTIGRASARGRTRDGFGRYLAIVMVVVTVPSLFDRMTVEVSSLVVGLFVLVIGAVIISRVFLVPGYLVCGDSTVTAIRRSRRASTGNGLLLLGFAVVLGTGTWALATAFGQLGGGISTALGGAVHAVTLAVLVDWTSESPVHTGTGGPPA